MQTLIALVGCGLLSTACGARTVWYGHSPDRQTRVEVFAQERQQFVQVNGRHSRPYAGIGTDSLVFSPDSQRLAYAAERRGAWVLVVDGRASREWDGIGEVVFSPDSERVAYAAESRGRWHVVVDGVVGVPVDGILRESLQFSPDSRRLAYVAQYAGGVHAVIDGVTSARYDGIGRLTFSPDSRRVGFLARVGGYAYAVVDGAIGPAYERIDGLAFGPGGEAGYVATGASGQVAVIGDLVSQPYRRVAALTPGPTSRSTPGDWAYIAQGADRSWSLVRDSQSAGTYDAIAIDSLRFSPDGQTLAFVAARGHSWFAVVGDRELGPYDAVEPTEFAARGRTWGFIAHDAAGSAVVIGDLDSGQYAEQRVGWAGNLRFDPLGARRGYLATEGGRKSVVVDGATFDFELVVDGSLLFSRDGAHWACLAAVDRSGRFWLIIDGRKRAPFDLVEVMYMMAGDPYDAMLDPATDGRIQSIVAAELERRTVGIDSGEVGRRGSRTAAIDLAARQPTPAIYRFAPARALALTASLGLVTSPGRADAEPGDNRDYILTGERIRLTDLVLWRMQADLATSGRSHLTVGATVIPKQPHGAKEMAWHEVHVGAVVAPLATRAPGLSVTAELAGGPLLGGTGWWVRSHVDVEFRRPLTETLSARVAMGGAGTWLALTGVDEHFVLASARAYSGLLMHRPRARLAGWLGTEFRLPLAHSSAVTDPLSGATLKPGRRIAFDAGLALSVAHRFHLFARLYLVSQGAATEDGAALPVLDDAFGYRQVILGVSRRFGIGAMSPALAVQ